MVLTRSIFLAILLFIVSLFALFCFYFYYMADSRSFLLHPADEIIILILFLITANLFRLVIMVIVKKKFIISIRTYLIFIQKALAIYFSVRLLPISLSIAFLVVYMKSVLFVVYISLIIGFHFFYRQRRQLASTSSKASSRTRLLLKISLYFTGYCLASILLLLPEIIVSYNTFDLTVYSIQYVREDISLDTYDVVAVDKGSKVYATEKWRLARYDFNPISLEYSLTEEQWDVNAQRMEYLPKEEKLLAANFTNDQRNLFILDKSLKVLDQTGDSHCELPIYVTYRNENRRIYYSCEVGDRIMEFDPVSRRLEAIIDVNMPNVVRLSEDERYLFAVPIQGSRICRYDFSTRKIDKGPQLPVLTLGLLTDEFRKSIYISNMLSGEVIVNDYETMLEKESITSGIGARDMAIDRKNGILYIGNYFDGTITMLDTSTFEMKKLFGGGKIRGVYFEPDTGRIYFASRLGIGYYKPGHGETAYTSNGFLSDIVYFFHNALPDVSFSSIRKFLTSFASILFFQERSIFSDRSRPFG